MRVDGAWRSSHYPAGELPRSTVEYETSGTRLLYAGMAPGFPLLRKPQAQAPLQLFVERRPCSTMWTVVRVCSELPNLVAIVRGEGRSTELVLLFVYKVDLGVYIFTGRFCCASM